MQDSDPDKVTDTKTIFDVSPWEIFWRNVIAGAGRGIGALIFQVIFLVVVVNLFMSYAWPVLEPLINTITVTTQTLEKLQLPGENDSFFQLP